MIIFFLCKTKLLLNLTIFNRRKRHSYLSITLRAVSTTIITENGAHQHGGSWSNGRRTAGPWTTGARSDISVGPNSPIYSAEAGKITRGHLHGKFLTYIKSIISNCKNVKCFNPNKKTFMYISNCNIFELIAIYM